jgi:hypothetical protein
MAKFLKFTVDHYRAMFFGILFPMLVLDGYMLKASGDLFRGYPNTQHGMKWNRSRQERLDAAIAEADAKILAWLRWAAPFWFTASILLSGCLGVVLGVAGIPMAKHVLWAVLFLGCRTIFDVLGFLVVFGGLDLVFFVLFFGLAGFCSFLLVVSSIATHRWHNGAWPYYSGRAISQSRGVLLACIPVLGALASLVVIVRGVVELIGWLIGHQ